MHLADALSCKMNKDSFRVTNPRNTQKSIILIGSDSNTCIIRKSSINAHKYLTDWTSANYSECLLPVNRRQAPSSDGTSILSKRFAVPCSTVHTATNYYQDEFLPN